MAGFVAGKTVVIDTGEAAERVTIASVGTAGLGGTGLTVTSPTTRPHFGPVAVEQITAQAGAVDVKLTNIPAPAPAATAQSAGQVGGRGGNAADAGRGGGRGAGPGGGGFGGGGRGGRSASSRESRCDHRRRPPHDRRRANAEQVTVTFVGSGGLTGSGVSFTPALRKDHNGDVLVHDEGTGITFVPTVKSAYAAGITATSTGTGITLAGALSPHGAGVEARDLGSGIVLTQPLSASVAEGEAVTSNMNAYYPQARWTAAIQNDFAARADWQLKPYAQTNHAPVVSVPARTRTAAPGQNVALSSTATDPDANRLTYKWWQYREAGTYPGAVVLSGADTGNATFMVPTNARPRPDDTPHPRGAGFRHAATNSLPARRRDGSMIGEGWPEGITLASETTGMALRTDRRGVLLIAVLDHAS